MRELYFFCIFICCIFSSPAEASVRLMDLEDRIQDFVLETKKIEVPGFPNAYNPSIIRWNGALLMSFKNIPDPKFSYNSHLHIIRLDDEFSAIGEAQLLDTRYADSTVPSRADDGRLVEVDGRLYIVYSDCKDEKMSRGGFRVYLAEIRQDSGHFYVVQNNGLFHFDGASQLVREKNWVPFDYEGKLLLAYSLEPHRIFLPHLGTTSCETFAESDRKILWDWGVLRGGTPALPLDETNYLSFFHSSKKVKSVHSSGEDVLHYVMGAYTFSRTPPFEITGISPEPIVGKNFYHGPIYKPYWHPVRVTFPCGFIMDENNIWISYGRQDHEAWVVKLDKKGLINSLKNTLFSF